MAADDRGPQGDRCPPCPAPPAPAGRVAAGGRRGARARRRAGALGAGRNAAPKAASRDSAPLRERPALRRDRPHRRMLGGGGAPERARGACKLERSVGSMRELEQNLKRARAANLDGRAAAAAAAFTARAEAEK